MVLIGTRNHLINSKMLSVNYWVACLLRRNIMNKVESLSGKNDPAFISGII